MSATVHLQYADINATRSSHHEEPPNSMHNSVFSLALCLPPGLSQCKCQSHLSSRLGLLIKHSQAVELNYFFSLSVSPVYIVFRGSWGDVLKL